MESTTEDIATLISAINSCISDASKVTLDLDMRKISVEDALSSFDELSFFTRFRYRRYLHQRIAELKNELECIRSENTRNEQVLRTDLRSLIRKILLVHSNEKCTVSKKQRSAVWENLSTRLAMDHETFIRYTNQCGCIV